MDVFAYALTDHALKRRPSLLPALPLRRPTSTLLEHGPHLPFDALTAHWAIHRNLIGVPVPTGYLSVTGVLPFSRTSIQAPESITKSTTLSPSGNHVCAITGAATDIKCCTLIQQDVLKEEEEKSRENYVPFREDISRLFSRGEFVLAPAYKTYIEAMQFVNRIGIHDRHTTDRSPRRPLTALATHEGAYRYVLLPYTDAARKLQSEFGLAQQTAEDLNDGIDPLTNAPDEEGTDRFPVVECHSHPFSVAIHA
ncbi:hypothetical protein EV122DRAFT_277830 [Schizophyllum commune]